MTDWPANCLFVFPDASLSTCLSYYLCICFCLWLFQIFPACIQYSVQHNLITFLCLSLKRATVFGPEPKDISPQIKQRHCSTFFFRYRTSSPVARSSSLALTWPVFWTAGPQCTSCWWAERWWSCAGLFGQTLSQVVRSVSVKWAALWLCVTLYILYIRNLLSAFEMQAFCSLSVALISVRMTQHCLHARQRVTACRGKLQCWEDLNTGFSQGMLYDIQ